MEKRRLVFGLKLLWGLALVAAVAWFSDIGESWKVVKSAQAWPLALATFLGVCSVALAATGVTIVGRAVDNKLGWFVGIKGFCLAWVVGFFLGRVSEFSLPVFWRRHLSMPKAAAVVLVDKLVSLSWITVLGALGLGLLIEPMAGWVAGGLGAFALAGLVLVIRSPAAGRVASKLLPDRWVERMRELPETFQLVMQGRRGALAANVAITGMRAVLHGFILTLLMMGIGQDLDPITGTAIQAMVSLTSLIPGSIMGLGYWESVYVLALGQAGIGTADALAAALIWRALNLAIMPPLYLFGSTQQGSRSAETEDIAH
jgi:uncharacterized membrane protein YbhN (UPF0104 family)